MPPATLDDSHDDVHGTGRVPGVGTAADAANSPNADAGDLTATLVACTAAGEVSRDAADRIFAAAYDELHAMAGREMAWQRPGHTLQPTALVNEVYLRLVDRSRIRWDGRAHFFGIAARAMRQLLVDHHRRKGSQKRGGDRRRVELHDELLQTVDKRIDAVELDQALDRLATLNERMARGVELRVFAGLTGEEIAVILGVSRKTVSEDWRFAAMWLRAELAGEELA